MYYLRVLLVGIYFGVILVKSEVVRWERIHQMFLFQEAHMYLIITTAIIVGGISMLLIKRFEVKTVDQPLHEIGDPAGQRQNPFARIVEGPGQVFARQHQHRGCGNHAEPQ